MQLGIGTGTEDGKVQRDIGKDEFIRLVRHSLNNGFSIIDTAPIYHTFWWIKDAISGVRRESMFIQCKLSAAVIFSPISEVINHFLHVIGTPYLDSVLVHCMTEKDWPERFMGQINALRIAKESGAIRHLGFSPHNLQSMRRGMDLEWLDIIMVRYNPFGVAMDGETGMSSEPSMDRVPIARDTIINVKKRTGCRVFAMKVFGNGSFNREERQRSFLDIKSSGIFDASILGFKSLEEIDEIVKLCR